MVIGAGIGGLATASLLAKAGHEVHVYEKAVTAGGRAGKLAKDGFTFDTGPSWYLMPDVFEHFYELMDEPIEKWLDLHKLTPAYKVFYESQDAIVVTGQLERDKQTFEAVEQGGGDALERYVARSKEIYELSLKHFLYTNFEDVRDLANTAVLRKSTMLPSLLLKPIHQYVSSYVRDMRLKQILEYPMVFLGTSPFSAPAMYSLMSALDFDEGVYYPMGGMYTIIESIETIARNHGVVFHYEGEVDKIRTHNGKAAGITLADGTQVDADVVVSNSDLHHTETQLLDGADRTYDEKYWQGKEPGPSALLLYLGIDGKVPELEHHNLLFVEAWKENFEAIYRDKQMPRPASIYVAKTSHSDPSVAPAGKENVFVLVPLPAGVEVDADELDTLADGYLQQIEEMTGASLRDRLLVKELFGPNDFLTQYYSWQSSMLGQSHLLKQSAFFRTPNKSKKLSNLYYVGGSTTPGIGLPMCLIGAELVYKRIIGETRGGRIARIVPGEAL
ncbi:phytoene desaturase [Candidatus Saccharibacteria bacterium]|nr:phytoene desaturase [Candidatus Saccharibacteria bacterium]